MIESITMDNSETDWTFESLTSMAFARAKPRYVNKYHYLKLYLCLNFLIN